MRHDGGAEDAGRQQHAFGPGELGNDGMVGDLAPVRFIKKGFDQIAERDDSEQRGDHRLHRAETA